MAQGQGGEATTAPNAIAAAAPASGVWDEGGDLRYIAKALIGASPYFSRSSEVLLGVVVCWVLGVVSLVGCCKKMHDAYGTPGVPDSIPRGPPGRGECPARTSWPYAS